MNSEAFHCDSANGTGQVVQADGRWLLCHMDVAQKCSSATYIMTVVLQLAHEKIMQRVVLDSTLKSRPHSLDLNFN